MFVSGIVDKLSLVTSNDGLDAHGNEIYRIQTSRETFFTNHALSPLARI